MRELEEMVGKVEDDKRILVKAQETLQNNLRMAESQLQVSFIIGNNLNFSIILYKDKDELIQNLTTDLNYCKVINIILVYHHYYQLCTLAITIYNKGIKQRIRKIEGHTKAS